MKDALPLALLAALAAAPSCGGGDGGDQTAKFVGAWTFQSGELTPVCVIGALMPFSLAGLNVSFTKIDASTLSLMINAACNVHFHVNGSKATVAANQTCTLDVGGAFGMQMVGIKTWTLTLSGDHIDNTIAGNVAGDVCTATGTGVLVRGTSDAGVPHDGGTHDGSGNAEAGGSDGGAAETGVADAGLEAGAETGGSDGADTETGTDTDGSDATNSDAGG
jgi:hypothetical protein